MWELPEASSRDDAGFLRKERGGVKGLETDPKALGEEETVTEAPARVGAGSPASSLFQEGTQVSKALKGWAVCEGTAWVRQE